MNTTEVQKNSVLGLRGRVLAGFGALLLLLVIATSIALYKVTVAENHAQRVIGSYLPSYDTYLTLTSQINATQASMASWVVTHQQEDKNDFNLIWDTINDSMDQLKTLSSQWSTANINKLHDLEGKLNNLKTLQTRVMQETDPATLMNEQLKPLLMSVLTDLTGKQINNTDRQSGILNEFYNKVETGTNNIISGMDTLRYIEYGLVILFILSSIIITFYTTRSILRYINIFRLQSTRIASGDLTQRITIENKDEMSMLGHDLNIMTDSLSSITTQITEACQHMVSMLTEVKHAIDTQSAGASEQASSINQITASLEEIEKSSAQTMQKAQTLGEVAEKTRAKGELGLDAVEQSVHGMKVVRDRVQTIAQTILDLSNQTQQVGEITAVVNTLAQQSKMLALNASIEAAKAGEAGKGFAVVAAEVKNLAEQSEHSTAQVQKILEDIRHATEKAVMAMEEGTKGVDIGTNLVEQTGEIVRGLNEVIHEATIASQQIEAAIRQEGIGIEQITAGMNEINQVTSSSVASVKETTEAIDTLGNIAANLKKYTDVYKV